jgi:hypothetical protein
MPLHHGTCSKKDPPGAEASRQFLVGWLVPGCLPKPTGIDGSPGELPAPLGGEASNRTPPRSSKMTRPVADDVTTTSGGRASTSVTTRPSKESHPIVIDSDGDEVSEINQDFVESLRRILVALSEWANSISHEDHRALDQEKRPMTMSVWRFCAKSAWISCWVCTWREFLHRSKSCSSKTNELLRICLPFQKWKRLMPKIKGCMGISLSAT